MKTVGRIQLVQRIRQRILRMGYPRLQMMLIVLLTGAVGFLASFVLLQAGMTAMWLRYPCAVLIGYLAFLLLLWAWLRTSVDDYVDLPDVGSLPDLPGGQGLPTFSGGGGSGGGGGASGSFDSDVGPPSLSLDMPAGDASSAELPGVGDALSAVGDADEFAVPLALIVLVAVLLLSSFWVVYIAPELFAELLLDGVLATTLYRRLRGLDTQHWLRTAVGRTVWLFFGIAAVASAVGAIMAWQAPGARSVGEVIQKLESERR